jgi:hypothetical protein
MADTVTIIPATAELRLVSGTKDNCDLIARITTIDGTITATLQDFHRAFSVNRNTWEFDLSNKGDPWYSPADKRATKVDEKHTLIVKYHQTSGEYVRRLNLDAFIYVRGNKLEFTEWYVLLPQL